MPVRPRVDAQVFGATLEQLAEQGQPPQLVPPKKIVDAARPPRAPLHKMFLWDNDRAGEQFRWMQARRFVSQLEIVLVEVKGSRAISTRGFWSVHVGKDRGYVPRHRVLSDRDLKLQVIATARSELESYIRKYQAVLTFGSFIPRLQTVMDDMRSALNKLQAAAMRKTKTDA
jgi:hypothetical protein